MIAAAFAGKMRIPVLAGLERRRQEGTQTTLSPMQRRANVSAAFVMAEASVLIIRGRKILLVHDVITTGATILAAVRALAPGYRCRVCAFHARSPYHSKTPEDNQAPAHPGSHYAHVHSSRDQRLRPNRQERT